VKLDHAFLDHLETFGPIARTLSMCLRPTFCAEDEDHTLVWGDWSSIEARMLPWLADNPGSREILDIFRDVDADPNAADIYMREAGNIHNIDPNEINGRILEAKRARYKNNETIQAAAKEAKGWRQEGKVAVLALGFGGSVGALMAMATGYGLYFSEERAEHIVETWRDANKWASTFWGALNDAFRNAYDNPGVAYEAGRLTYIHDSGYHGGSTFCIQPCGRVLTYPNLKWKKIERANRQGETYEQTVLTYRKGYKWGSIWHGILSENPTQGTAASILRAKLRQMEADRLSGASRSFETRFHTHDEIGGHCHIDDEAFARAYVKRVMDEPLDWTDGLPLVSEISSYWAYTKAVE